MRLRHLLAASLLIGPSLLTGQSALGQQQPGQQWFVPPGQGAQQPAQQQRPPAQQQRPPAQQQRPAQAPAAGQRTPPPVIAIVDIPEVQRLSAAFNQVREEIERRRATLNTDLQREQGRWREEQQALAAARATLPPEQLRQRERELQERITDAQRIFRDRSRAIDQAAQAGLGQIEQALGAVIRQVAASRGVNIVLPRPLVIFNDSGFDLTDEISAQMNRVLRSVTIPPEGAPPVDAPPAANGAPPPPPPPAPAAPAAPARRN
ncbi:OmpH family outer membrane protein [Falsiroseomonas sp. HC035]|uniref:OmpH family outer membrane protein n=1 Tax=Falsiroseomonas sp. HC035 TaxID=3390999 RepID=UPI003D315A86